MVDEKTIEELRALLAKATPGPWSTHLVDDTTIISPDREVGTTCDSSQTERDDGYNIEYERMEADAALIAAMRNALPDLLDAAERASRAREDALREAVAVAKMVSDAIRPHEKEPCESVGAAKVASALSCLIGKPKGGDANDKSKERTRDPATSPGVITGASGEAKQVDPVDGGEDA